MRIGCDGSRHLCCVWIPKPFAVCSLLYGWDAAVPGLCDAEASDLVLEPVSTLSPTCQHLGCDGRVKSRQGVASRALGSCGVSWERCGHCCVYICMWGDGSIYSPVFLRPFYALV